MKACSSYEHMAIWSQLQFPPHIISAWNRARGVQLRQWPTGILYQWVQSVNSQSRSRHWSRWVKNLSVEDSCFYSSMPAEAVTTAVVEYASFHSLCCVLSRKVKSFKQTNIASVGTVCSVKTYNKCSKCCLLALTHAPTIILPLVNCPANDSLFELSPGIRCSGVASVWSCYRSYGNYAAGSKLN